MSARDAEPARIRLGDETDLHDAATLQIEDDASDALPSGALVATDVKFRLRLLACFPDDALEEHLRVIDAEGVPVDLARAINRNGDVLGLGLRGDVHRF